MTENFLFKAIFISLALHTAVVCGLYFSKPNAPHHQAVHQNRVEISYKSARKRAVDVREHPIRPSQRLDLNDDQKFLTDGSIPVSMEKERPMLPFGMLYEHKQEHMRGMELSHRIIIMPIRSEKINNPVYAAYQEMVRDRIKDRVYENYDKMESGSVYLTFLVDAHGILKAAQIIASKTTASAHLQEIAMRSLQEASPFPPFLNGMHLTEYPLNIEIEYNVSND